jgi:hypothetical protein
MPPSSFKKLSLKQLLAKSGNSNYYNATVINEHKYLHEQTYEFLKSLNKENCMTSLSYVPEINFFKMVFPESHKEKLKMNLVLKLKS